MCLPLTPFSLSGGPTQPYLLICVFLSIRHPHSVVPFLSISTFNLLLWVFISTCFFLPFFLNVFFYLHCFLLPQKNEGDLFHRLWHVMNEILDLRRQVLVGHLTHDRMRDVKQHITARLDWGNEWVDGPLFNGFADFFFFFFLQFPLKGPYPGSYVCLFFFYVSGHLLFIGSTFQLVLRLIFCPLLSVWNLFSLKRCTKIKWQWLQAAWRAAIHHREHSVGIFLRVWKLGFFIAW